MAHDGGWRATRAARSARAETGTRRTGKSDAVSATGFARIGSNPKRRTTKSHDGTVTHDNARNSIGGVGNGYSDENLLVGINAGGLNSAQIEVDFAVGFRSLVWLRNLEERVEVRVVADADQEANVGIRE